MFCHTPNYDVIWPIEDISNEYFLYKKIPYLAIPKFGKYKIQETVILYRPFASIIFGQFLLGWTIAIWTEWGFYIVETSMKVNTPLQRLVDFNTHAFLILNYFSPFFRRTGKKNKVLGWRGGLRRGSYVLFDSAPCIVKATRRAVLTRPVPAVQLGQSLFCPSRFLFL